ncbi:inducible metalloproteinase inhibitor protein-like [Spodoptera litura]|uniref:Inducible metalloproteinase inhibitor protein-like n=1 Tax=Spodoptera litura TaxID=69820 RepID=A0A9J7DUQ6_SPOLT|nr:inducible metalloproteinase inhibitor protein-like [Spodoptera litura]
MFLVLMICLVGSVVAQDKFLYKPRVRNIECGANEVFECIFSCPPQPICNTRHENITCSTVEETCSHWCVCVPGYIRNTLGGDCIPKSYCALPCSEFEEATDCKRVCLNETCAGIGGPNTCIQRPCEPGCDCKPGFYRKEERRPCVPLCECPEKRYSDECLNKTVNNEFW